MNRDHPLRATPLEIAAGFVVGEHPGADPVADDGDGDPLRALEQATLPALSRPPCLVSFSGGRDSSAVLAVASRAARRHGLALPVPVTLRFGAAADTHETSWQDDVVTHLGLDDWIRIDAGEELDLLGPHSAAALSRHGVLWPPNTYVHAPMLQRATGGSLLTGLEGDGLLGGWRWLRVADVVTGRARPEPRDLLRLAHAAMPKRARRVIASRRAHSTPLWLKQEAQRAVTKRWAAEEAAEPVAWNERVRWWARRRYLAVARNSFQVLAAAENVSLGHPLLDPRWLAALARVGGRTGAGDRTRWMRALFADILPARVVARSSKAVFTHALWGEPSRAFAKTWSGAGVDTELVDVATLRATWTNPVPDFRSACLLQRAWALTSSGHKL
ncbi:hypothetical protein BH20ACT23_BH20ACT23_14510 [soil metagenome]